MTCSDLASMISFIHFIQVTLHSRLNVALPLALSPPGPQLAWPSYRILTTKMPDNAL